MGLVRSIYLSILAAVYVGQTLSTANIAAAWSNSTTTPTSPVLGNSISAVSILQSSTSGGSLTESAIHDSSASASSAASYESKDDGTSPRSASAIPLEQSTSSNLSHTSTGFPKTNPLISDGLNDTNGTGSPVPSSITTLNSASHGTCTFPPYVNSTSGLHTVNDTSCFTNITGPWLMAAWCNEASQQWLKEVLTVVSMNYTWPEPWWDTTLIMPANATPYTTLCDGFARAHGTAVYKSVLRMHTIRDYVATSTVPESPSISTPCTIDVAQCSYLWSKFDNVRGIRATSPACPSPSTTSSAWTWTCSYTHPDGSHAYHPLCAIVGNNVQMAYWPVSRVGDLCGKLTQVPSNITTHQTAYIWGTSVTSPRGPDVLPYSFRD
jgi:hypothetical protein